MADFLSAGRIARRYVLCVASAEAGMGLITLVGNLEAYYNSGFAYGFWYSVIAPVGMVLGLVGFCNYRFRETRAMTLGQFFEMRYSRPFRITASFVQAFYGVLNYGIFPAVGARFMMYFLRLPVTFSLFGLQVSTFAALMAVALGLACFIACAGGQVTIMVTDCVQGILSYPIYLVIAIFFLWRFSWWDELLPAIAARPDGVSFLNPFDTGGLRDFNIFFVMSGLLGTFLMRLSWGSRGYDSAARDAHEAKMGAVLGTWRSGFSSMMFVLVAVVAYAFNNHPDFAAASARARAALAAKTYEDVAHSSSAAIPSGEAEALAAAFAAVEPRAQFTSRAEYRALAADAGPDAAAKRFAAETADPFLAAASATLGGDRSEAELSAMSPAERADWGAKRARNQTFSTIFTQMRVPATIRAILPTGLVGLFCAMALFLMLSTDTTYLHGWASVIVQDFLLPLRSKPWPPARQIRNLRIAICGVALFGFLFSYFFGQVDFILMFFAITGALWMASGPIITLGLYWKRGTTAAAFSALILGAAAAIGAIFAQKYWVSSLYPWIAAHGFAPALDRILRALSSPFEPWVHWELTAGKFPINSVEVGVITQLFTLLVYVAVSLATCRTPFNMDRLLHRGAYGDARERAREAARVPLLQRILGIDGNYSRGDRILAWSVFAYSFLWSFCLCFLGNVVWHVLGERGILPRQPESWWGIYFFAGSICIACAIGVVSTFWFGICSTRDLLRLFRDLEERERSGGGLNALDDGRVEGHVSLSDAAEVARVEAAATPARRGRGAVLFSGGLDSILAALILREQGCEVTGIAFASPFFSPRQARSSAALIGLPLEVVDFTDDILALVEHPRHGFGGALNPCIDCHARMISRAGEIVRQRGWDFIATGEVLNQRPMSQNRRSLEIVAQDCGVADILVRPLSAKLLPETPVESRGLIDRGRLCAIEGRSRREQKALAEHFGLKDYPSSAGGCLLTEKLYANKLARLRNQGRLHDRPAVALLKFGRHFALPGGAKAIVGRNAAENEAMRVLATEDYLLLRPIGVPGPTTLLEGAASPDDLDTAIRLCAGYSDRADGDISIRVFRGETLLEERQVAPMPREEARGWLL